MPIDVQLPSGERVRVQTDDPQAAAKAARRYFEKSQGAEGKRTEIAPPFDPAGENIPWHEQPATQTRPQAPPESGPDNALARDAMIGLQGTGRGLAELAGAPVDIATLGLNAGAAGVEAGVNAFLPEDSEIKIGRITDPIGGSQSIRDAASAGTEAAGVPLVEEGDLEGPERYTYNISRFGAQMVAPSAAIGRTGANAARVYNPRPTTADRLATSARRPYQEAASRAAAASSRPRAVMEANRPLVVDAAAGAGAGSANVIAEENDLGPLAQGLAVLGGGVGGATAARVPSGGQKIFEYVVTNRLPDPNVPADRVTGAQPSRGTARRAAQMAQESAMDPARAADTLEERAQDYRRADMPAPAAGGLSNDEGLAGLESEARRQAPAQFQRQDRAVEQAASGQVRSLSPGDDVNARAATEYVTGDVRNRQTAAQGRVAAGRTAVEEAEAAERATGDQLAANRGTGEAASEAIDTELRSTLDRERAEKNRRFDEIDPDRSVMRDISPLAQAAQYVKDRLSTLAPTNRVLPRDFVNRIDALVPKYQTRAVDTGLTDEAGNPITRSETMNVGGPGEAPFADINALRAPLSDAIAQARRNNQGALVQSLERLKREVDAETYRLAEEGGPAAQRAAGALENYRDRYAPRFTEGEGGRFRRDLARNAPGATPPSKTAGRFLRSGAGSKEAAADLQRILDVSPNRQSATQAARQYLLDSLAGTVGADGKVSPVRLREWVDRRRGALDAFPGIRDEILQTQRDVVNQRAATTRLQRELEEAVGAQKRTERELQDSALGIMVDADPVVAVRRVFGSKDPQRAMREITRKVDQDPAAAAGWRKAVADYLAQTVTSGNTAKTTEGARPASLAQLSDLFEKHTAVLTEVYGPEQMNALRRAQMAVEDLAKSRQGKAQTTTTAEDVARLLRYSEIGLKGTFGGLRGGNMFRNLRLAIKTIPDLDGDAKAAEVVRQAMFDPELAAHLLRAPVPARRQANWNRRLMSIMGLAEGAREAQGEPSEIDIHQFDREDGRPVAGE